MDFRDQNLGWSETKTALFTMRLSFSARVAHWARSRCGEAFLEGHVFAFERLGGVPLDKISYDNLNSAVKQVLSGRSREENERWLAFRSHYDFDAFYCQPGNEGSHEEGGVRGKAAGSVATTTCRCRSWTSIDELNVLREQWDDPDDRLGRTRCAGGSVVDPRAG